MPQDLDKKQEILKLLNTLDPERLTKQNFVDAFEKVVDFNVDLKERFEKMLDALDMSHQTITMKNREDYDRGLNDLKSQVDSAFVGKVVARLEREHGERMEKVEEKLKQVDEKVSTLKDGYTPIKGKDYFDGKHGEDGRKIRSEECRDKLECLTGDERLSMEAIRGLKEELKALRKLVGGGKLLGGVINKGVQLETPQGTVDGSNTSFTAFKTPMYLVADGATYFENNGYTLSGKTLTLSVAPVSYVRSFY